jgi:hypothetical protein
MVLSCSIDLTKGSTDLCDSVPLSPSTYTFSSSCSLTAAIDDEILASFEAVICEHTCEESGDQGTGAASMTYADHEGSLIGVSW